jgi:predicted nucleotidyltransferase
MSNLNERVFHASEADDPRAAGQARRAARRRTLWLEAARLALAAAEMGADLVLLFGSLARGQTNSFSDLDMVIVWETPLPFVERLAAVYERLRPQIEADILVYTPAEYALMRDRPFLRDALREGEVLYAAERSGRGSALAGTG